MAAVTADTLTLPRFTKPSIESRGRKVQSLTTAPAGFEGEGFPVRRAFAGVHPSLLDPFVHMDQMGAIDYSPGEPKGTSWHPHRGFETVTYMLDGQFQHQDSHGGGGLISDGDTQWMTAGSGILHIETPPEQLVISGGLFHGVQLWVNLPSTEKMISPAYQNLEGGDVVLFTSPDAGSLFRLIAGNVADFTGPGSTKTPIAYLHATIMPGSRAELPWNPAYNALAYALSGSGTVGSDDVAITGGQLAVFDFGSHLEMAADGSEPLELILLGGQPINEPIATYGPFVMNTKAEVQQAMDDYQSGRFGRIPPGALQPYRPA
ncbi:MAG: pirin family protein [Microthrixaceae bacterium]